MSLQQKIYHEKIYENLAKATLKRNQELQKQQLLHSELMAHYEHEIFRNQIDQRRLQFRHFVAEKLQQQRLQRGIDEEHFHQEYLERIQKLRKQRQRLGAHSLQPIPHNYTYIQENDHSLLCEGLANQSNSNKKKVFIKEQSNPINQNNRQYLQQPIDPEINGRLFYNSALVDKLQNRWIPYDQRTDHESNKNQEKQLYIEKHHDKLNELHQSIKETKVPNLSNTSSVSVSQELTKKDESPNKPANLMVGQPTTNKSLIINKKPILIEEQDEESGRNSGKIYHSSKNVSQKKKKVQSLMKNNKENRLNLSSFADSKPYYMNIETKKNQKVEYKGIMDRIKNRLELSSVVYEDSQHRNILHQKNHLTNKYQTECKMRKEMISRICNSKEVRQKYKNVGLAIANQN